MENNTQNQEQTPDQNMASPAPTATAPATETPAQTNDWTPEQKQQMKELILPVNRSGWTVAAGWIAIFNILIITSAILGPISIILAIIGLHDIKKNPTKKGKYRAWFAIIFSVLTMLALTASVLYTA